MTKQRSKREIEEERKALQEEIAKKQSAFQKEIASQVEREKALEKELKDMKYQEQQDLIELLRDSRELVLRMLDHGRTSCSDDCVTNGWGSRSDGGCRCNKCGLIELMDGTEKLPRDMRIEFSVEFYHD